MEYFIKRSHTCFVHSLRAPKIPEGCFDGDDNDDDDNAGAGASPRNNV